MKKLLFFFTLLTLLGLSGAVKAQTMVVNCYPPTEEYATGYTDGTVKTSGEMHTVSNDGVQGWMMFDVSAIPDGAIINSITLKFYCTSTSSSWVKLTPAGELNPTTASAAELYSAITNNSTMYNSGEYISGFGTTGIKTFTLNATAINNLQTNGLTNDYFIIGFNEYESGSSTYYLNASGYDDATNIPYIEVNYFYTTEPYIELEPSTTTIFTGLTKTLTATVGNISGTPTITYESDDESVATVSGNGTSATVTAIAPGTATITATMDYNATIYTATCDITVEDLSYCTPSPSSVDGSGITNVTFGTGENVVNNNTHPFADPYYGDYSTQIGTMNAGVESTVSITFNTCSYNYCYNYGTIIWVDLDNSFSFEDDEIVFAGQSASESYPSDEHTLNATFTIPATQALGDYRMRIGAADSYFDYYISSNSGNHDPCYTGTYAIFEDYTLRVIEAPSCMTPTALSLSRNGNQITATWNGTATDYNIDINGTVTNNVTSPYVFDAELSTAYTIKVQANCGDETSEWTNTSSITTPSCWVGHTIEYTLNDSYGDGWDGASITVVEGCNEVVTLTVASGYSNSGTFELCGDYCEFTYNKGTCCDGEHSWTFTKGGSSLFAGYGNSNMSDGEVLYSDGTQTCPKPTDLDYEIPGARNVDLSWTEIGTAEAWQICLNDDMNNLVDVTVADLNSGVYTLGDLDPETDYTVKVRAVCGSSDSSCWSNEIYFTTDIACPAPTNPTVGTPAPNQVELSWTKNGEETAWQLRVNGDMDHLIDVTAGVNINPEGNYATVENGTVTYTLTNLEASTAYTVVVRANCGSEDGQSEWLSFDNFTTAASCPTPVLESTGITGITGHSANVVWTGFDENDSYAVYYRVKEHIDGTVENFDENSIPTGWELKQGLLSNVMAGTVTLTTASYGWSFGSGNGVFNNHARTEIYGTSKKHWLITPSKTLTSNAALNFDLALTNWSGTLGTPATNGTDDKFVVLITTDDGATWTILRQWDNEDGSTYVYNNITCSAAGEHVSIDLSAYDGETVKVAFYGESTTSNADNYLHIDNVTIGTLVPASTWQTENVTDPATSLTGLDPETPYEVYVTGHCATGDVTTDASATQTFTTTVACPAPTSLQFVSATTATATVQWTSPLDTWIVAYKAEGENDFTELSPTTDNPFTIPNLNPATNYTVRVKADCSANSDGSSEWSNEISFPTECPDNFPLDYTCGFEGPNTTGTNILPLCWTRMGTSTSYPYVVINSNYAHEGTRLLYFYKSSSASNANEIAVLPIIDANLNTMRISFYGKLSSTSNDGTINIGYVTSLTDASTFTSVQTVTLTTSYEKYTVSFGNVDSETSGYIALQSLYNTATATIYIDDITVEPIPSCVEPSVLEVTATTSTTATLSWTVGGTETTWDIYCSTENVAPTSSTTPLVSATTDNPATINDLTASSIYYVWVRAHCSDADQSPWIGGISFTTKCDAITVFPITYGFETSEGFPANASTPTTNQLGNCWRNEATVQNGTYATRVWGTSTTNKHGGSQALVLPDKGNNTNFAKTLLAFPPMNFTSANGYKVSFWIKRDGSSSNPEGFKVYVSNTDTIDDSAIELGHYSRNYGIAYPKVESASGWYQYNIYIPQSLITGTTNLIFEGQSYYGNPTYVDDITIEEGPSCYPVGTLAAATNITAVSADLSWSLVDNNQDAWQIEYATNENFTDLQTEDADENDGFTLSGLTPETHYWVRVKADCGNNDYGEVSNTINFTTPIACDAPTALTLDEATTSSLTVSWTENGTATSWIVGYKAEGEETFTDNMTVNTNPYTIDGLEEGTNYTVRVKSNCGNGYYSHELNGIFQTVASCPAPTNLAVTDNSETAHGATITWNGNSENDSYTLQYREVITAPGVENLTYGFEDGTQGWTTIDADGHGNAWSRYNGNANSGSSYSMKATYNSNYTHQDYLVSPQITLGGTLSFYAKRESTSYSDNFRVFLSTSGNTDAADFSIELTEGDVTPTTSYSQYTYDLSSYSGTGYVAIVYTAPSNQYYLYIDDINYTVSVEGEYGEWQDITNVTGTSYTFGTETVSLTPETNYQVRVKGVCDNTPSPASNIVGFTTLEACGAPKDFVLGDVEAHQASFSWTAGNGNEAWTVFVKKHSDAEYPTEYTSVTTAPTSEAPVTINELDAATAYDVKIVPDCDEDKTLEVENAFTTKCDVRTDFPIFYGFETSEGFPSNASTPTTNQLGNCWRNQATVQNGNNSTRVWGTSTANKHDGSQALILPDKGNNTNFAKTMLAFPAMDFTSANGYKVSFWIYRNGSNTNAEGFKVYASNTDTIDASAVLLGHYSRNYGQAYPKTESSSGWYNYDFYIPQATITGTTYLIFEGQSYYGSATYVDDITIEEAPSCYPVGTLAAATNITAVSADLSWTLVDNNQDAWQVAYKADDDEEFTIVTNVTDVHENYPLNGLSPETHYTVKVRAYCGTDDQGEWSNTITFTTPIACEAPTDLSLEISNTNSLTVSWTENGTATSWIVGYKAEGEETFTDNMTVNTNPYTIDGLEEGTNYTVRVKSNCGNGYYSHELNGIFQTEASCPAPTNLAVTDDSETAHGATITWNGNSENDSYTVEYAKGPLTGLSTLLNEGFEDGSMPTGWSSTGSWAISAGTGHSNTSIDATTNAATGNSNVHYYNNSASQSGILITPAINLEGKESATLTFNYVNPEWSNGRYALTVSYRVNEGDWIQLDSYNSAQDTWTGKTIQLTGMAANYQIGFHVTGYNSDYGHGVGLDDITITAEYTPTYTWNELATNATSPYTINTLDPETQYVVRTKGICSENTSPYSNIVGFITGVACQAPTDLTVGTPTHEEVELSWTENGSATAWVVAFKADGETNYIERNVDENPYTLDNLNESTTYTVKVKADCGNEGASTWSNEETFTTLEACGTPTAFILGTVNTHDASFSWTAGNSNISWDVYVKAQGGEFPATPNATVTNPTATINELIANTTYSVKIVPNCDDTKSLEVTNAFTTKCEAIIIDAEHSFTENFDATTFPPTACWNSIASGTYNWSRSTSQNHSVSGSASAYSNYYGDIYLLMPNLTISNDNTDVLLTFWSYNTYTGSYDKNSLVLINGDTETELWSPSSVSQAWKCDTINLSSYKGQTISLAFKYEGNNAHGWYIDDIKVGFTHTIAATANTTEGGTVTGAGTYFHGEEATLTATPADHHRFVNWTVNDVEVSTANPYTITVTQNSNIVANFELITFEIGAISRLDERGNVTGFVGDPSLDSAFVTGTHYVEGTMITLTANPYTGYEFASWSEYNYPNDIPIESGATYSFEVSHAMTLIADFSPINYLVTATANPTEGGSVTGEGTYNHGTTATLNATPAEHYHFVNWTVNDVEVSTANPYTITVTQDSNIVANFAINSYNITADVTPEGSGTVTGSGSYEYNSTATLTATANTGYHFVNWTKGGEVIESSTIVITVTEDANYTVNFALNSYEVNATTDPIGGGSVSGTGTYNHGATATLTATANTGYNFTNWTEGGQVVSTDAIYSFEVTDNRILVANFGLNSYEITATANPTEGGTVSGAGTYEHGASATLTATANEGYSFTNWTKDGVEVANGVTYSFPVTEDAAYVANFTLSSYEISAYVNPIEGGSVSGAGTFNHGATATLTATANDHYNFTNWTEGGVEVSTEATYSFQVTGERNLVANFTLKSYEVTVSANPTEGGTVSGAGTYEHGASATLTATPAANYLFTNWTKGGVVVSSNATYSFTTTEAGDYVANFTQMGVVATPSFTPAAGTYFVAYTENQTVNLTCPTPGATIYYTTDGSEPTANSEVYTEPISIGNNTEVTIKAIATMDEMVNSNVATATYKVIPLYNIIISSDISNGTVSASRQTAAKDSVVILTAEASTGYHFDSWHVTSGNEVIAVNNNQFIMPAGNVTVSANFEANVYTVTATIDPTEGGTVNGTGNYSYGTQATLTAVPATGYEFVRWEDESTNASRTITVTGDVNVTANFALQKHDISVTANPNEGGSVTGANTYNYGTTATLTATANEGYTFVNWTEGGQEVSTNATLEFTVTGARTLVANFSLNSYNITATANPNAGGTVNGAGTFNHGATATLTAIPAENYLFSHWTENDVVVEGAGATYSFTVEGPRSLVAHFDAMGIVKTPTFNPVASTYNVAQQVTISCLTEGATIYYTMDGSEPNVQSYTYTDPITTTDNGTTIIKAVAMKDNMVNSEIATAEYVIVPLYSITVADVTGGTLSTNPESSATMGTVVTLTATETTGYSFNNDWSITNTTNGQPVNLVNGNQFTMPAGNVSVSASFSLIDYTVDANITPENSGSVTGTGNSFHYGEQATLTAVPAEGYEFVSWEDQSTTNPRTVEVTDNVTVSATFALVNYSITVADVNGGTLSTNPESSATMGTVVTLTATETTGYSFNNDWSITNTTNGQPVELVNGNQFTMPAGNVSVSASFSLIDYTVDANITPENSGSVIGTGNSFHYGEQATLTAVPAEGYEFVSWEDQSTTNPRTVEVTDNVTVSATFALVNYSITVADVNGGTLSTNPESSATMGTVVTLTATETTGYSFNNDWSITNTTNGQPVELVNGNQFTMPAGNVSVNASFTINNHLLTIHYVYSDQTSAADDYTATLDYGSEYNVTSPEITGYTADQLAISGTMPDEDVTVTVTYGTDVHTLTIHYVYAAGGTAHADEVRQIAYGAEYSVASPAITGYTPDVATVAGTMGTADVTETVTYTINSYEVSATANPTEGGNVEGAGIYNHSANATLTATAATGYTFVNWTENGNVVSTDATYSFQVTGERALVANFDTLSYNITASINPTEGGTVEGAGTYKHFKTATLTATAATGYTFVNWTEGGQEVSTNATYEFTVTGARTLVANFSLNNYEIAATANPTAGGNVTGAGNYDHFATATLTATAATGYTFVNWTEGGQEVSTNATYEFNVTGTRTLVANFSLNSYDITATANPTTGGNVTGAGNYDHFATATLTATANEGYTFVNWTEGGQEVSTNATYEFNVTGARTLVANFSLNSYAVSATANPSAAGSITGAGTYNHGAEVTVSTTVNTGFYFVSWTENGNVVSTSTSYTFTFTGARTLVANFDTLSYNIAASANPNAGGTVEGAGTYKHFKTATLTATAATGYTFVNWTEGGQEVSTNATYEFNVTGARTLVANFSLNSYDITATVNPNAGGSVNGAGTFNHGATATLTATAATGYTFVNWTEGGQEVSTNATYEFTVTGAKTLVANFSLNSYEVSATANPNAGGSVNGAGTFNHGATATLTATPATGYTFVNWTEGGQEVSTNATLEFTVTGARTLVANFSLNSYDITATANPSAAGTITGAGTYSHGAEVTVSTTVNTGFYFVSWTENGNVVSTSTSYTFTFTGARTLVANFDTLSYNIAASANPNAGGTVEGAGTYKHFKTATLTATPATGYTFVNWTEGGQEVSTNATYEFNVTGARTLVANFSLNSYDITTTANPNAGGTVNGAGTFNHGATATLTATANEGYTFVNWTEGGQEVSTNAAYEFTVTGARTLVANFSLNSYDITATVNPNAGGSVNGAGTFNHGATATLTATAATGYTFVNWTEGGQEVSTNATYEFNVTGARTLVANFSLNSYAVSATANPSTGGTVEGTGNYNHFTNATLTATPATGYYFVSWTENGNVVSTSTSYGFEVTGAKELVANFDTLSYNITVAANLTAGGTVSGADEYKHFTTATVTANPSEGYSFANWTENGNVVSTDASYSFQVTGARNLVANFTINSYNLTIRYLYSNGTTAAVSYTAALDYNAPYNVTSPTIDGYTADKLVVSGNMPASNVIDTVVYRNDVHTLTIHYVYADNTTAHADYVSEYEFSESYSVVSPNITGYTPNTATVSGTMGTEDVTMTVTYTINSYQVNIHYVADGTTAPEDYSQTYNYGVEYSVASPAVTGYTPDIATVNGTMGTEAVNVTVTYTVNQYNLTINYLYTDNTTAYATHTEQVNYNANYSVTSPTIEGFVASQDVVSGIMPAHDVTETVTYGTDVYTLTIHYVYANGTQAYNDNVRQISFGAGYSVNSPEIVGYTPDQAVVSGTMGAAAVEITVTYTINNHLLTINYVKEDNTEAATAYTSTLNYGAAYAVTSPSVTGYVANRSVVSGSMPDENVTVTITYYQVKVNIVDATNCAGNGNGSITVTAPTGNFEYSLNGTNFQTNNIFNGLNANDYTLYIRPTGEDFNYIGTWTVASDITMPTVNVAANDSVFCLNNSIQLNGNGSSIGSEYSYAWTGPANYSSSDRNPAIFNASNGNMSGTYTLTVTNTTTQCASSQSLNIYVNDVTNPNYVFTISGFNAVGNISLGESSTTVNILTPTINHFMNGIVEDYSANNVTLSNDAPAEYTATGDYNVTWTATDACGNIATCTIVVTITSSVCPMVQDVDGNIYSTVAIGSTCWMASNLKTTHYADGREITNIYRYYYEGAPNVEENVSIYGLLYDWYDALDVTRPTRSIRVQGICPDGWYLPNEEDFEQLNTIPVTDLRSTNYWMINPGTNATNYDLRPAGMFNHTTNRYENLHGNAYLWSTSEINSTEAHCHMADCNCYMIYDLIYNKLNAFSVRCVKGE